ncbi:MAG: hypothetical protein ACXADY_06895 [Candidatus Hodarchaeales archaeon]
MTKTNSEMQLIEIEGFSYHFRSFGFFWVVLVTDVPKIHENLIQMVGLRFINDYGNILMDWNSNLDIFTPFSDTIHEIIKTETTIDESRSIKPRKKLGTGEIFTLPSNLQKTAIAMISLEEATIKDLMKESGENKDVIIKNLTVLQKMGFIGKKQGKRKTTYFCSI